MAGSVKTGLMNTATGTLGGAYLAAVNCPQGWWMAANLGAGSVRILIGAAIGGIAALAISRRLVPEFSAR
jgi:hypothetical protein